MFSLTEPVLAEMGVSKIGDRLYLVDCLQSLYEELTVRFTRSYPPNLLTATRPRRRDRAPCWI